MIPRGPEGEDGRRGPVRPTLRRRARPARAGRRAATPSCRWRRRSPTSASPIRPGCSSASSTASAASRSSTMATRAAALAQRAEPGRAVPGDRGRRSRPSRRMPFVVDGEVVAFDGAQTSFARLQQRGERPVCDLPLSLRPAAPGRPRHHRAAASRAQGAAAPRARVLAGRSASRRTATATARSSCARACAAGWEGLIAKRADAPYTHGRSRDWLKFKCSAEQELVIGGFTAPRGSRHRSRRPAAGALLRRPPALRRQGRHRLHAGHAARPGRAARAAAPRRLRPSPTRPRLRDATWVEPRLVAQVGFTEWTRDGRLRHPRFLGLREDKAAEEVVRE